MKNKNWKILDLKKRRRLRGELAKAEQQLKQPHMMGTRESVEAARNRIKQQLETLDREAKYKGLIQDREGNCVSPG